MEKTSVNRGKITSTQRKQHIAPKLQLLHIQRNAQQRSPSIAKRFSAWAASGRPRVCSDWRFRSISAMLKSMKHARS
jgi:hypothetical protein